MKKYSYFALICVAAAAGCGASNPSEAYLNRLHSESPQQQWETIKKNGGLSPSQLANQADAIQGASPEQKAAWKREVMSSAGPPPNRVPGNTSQNPPPPGVGGK